MKTLQALAVVALVMVALGAATVLGFATGGASTSTTYTCNASDLTASGPCTACTLATCPPAGSSTTSSSGTVTSTSVSSTITATTTTAASATTTGTSTYADSAYGLQLVLSLNTTEILAGQTVQVNVGEFNALERVNNVTKGGDWQVPAVLSACPNMNDQPFGIALYRGYYTAANVSNGVQLQIFPPTVCPMYIRLVTGYAFQAESNLAAIIPGSGLAPMNASISITTIEQGDVAQTPPLSGGLYTVVAADEWGGLAFLYFQVNDLP